MGGIPGQNTKWPQDHSDALVALILDGRGSYNDFAGRLNLTFGTNYTRNSCIGRAKRLGHCKPIVLGISQRAIEARQRRERERNAMRRLQRWSQNPQLEFREEMAAERLAEKKLSRAKVLARNKPTSPAYRNCLPRLPEMSKDALRAMIAAAFQNTAAMETA